jgi:hypothetical protein
MSPENLFAVALRLMAVWFLVLGFITIASMATGPFATFLVGTGLMVVATVVYPFRRDGAL